MLLITCPWCGPRDEIEFHYGGEAHIARPRDPALLSDAEWADYLFMRKNPKGAHLERWSHAQGCRRWFNAERSTVTHQILRTYPMDMAGKTIEAEGQPAAAGETTGRS